MKVEKKYLLIIAGAVWFIAGINIFNIGIRASGGKWTWLMLTAAFAVYLLFHNMVFRKMVKKHTRRITAYADGRHHILKFFDRQAYIIMAGMITLGVSLRLSHLLPDACIAMFYAGLGFSLIIAGVSFVLQFSRYRKLGLHTQ